MAWNTPQTGDASAMTQLKLNEIEAIKIWVSAIRSPIILQQSNKAPRQQRRHILLMVVGRTENARQSAPTVGQRKKIAPFAGA
jgi:hypothetical protein